MCFKLIDRLVMYERKLVILWNMSERSSVYRDCYRLDCSTVRNCALGIIKIYKKITGWNYTPQMVWIFKNLGSRLFSPKKWICMCKVSDIWHNCSVNLLVWFETPVVLRLKFDWTSRGVVSEKWGNDLPWKELLRIPLRTCSTDWYRSSSLQL